LIDVIYTASSEKVPSQQLKNEVLGLELLGAGFNIFCCGFWGILEHNNEDTTPLLPFNFGSGMLQ
jgi:hypothetical protein